MCEEFRLKAKRVSPFPLDELVNDQTSFNHRTIVFMAANVV